MVDHVCQQREKGKVLYFITYNYLDPLQSPLTAEKAARFLGICHRQILKYLCGGKHYDRECFHRIQPKLYAFLEYGSKPKKRYVYGIAPNPTTSFHHHCILIADSSHTGKLDALLDPITRYQFAKQKLALGCLKTFDVQRIGSARDDVRTTV